MNRSFFYWRLAFQNLRRNKRHSVPYMLTCIGTIMMFYILCTLVHGRLLDTQLTFGIGTIKELLLLGVWVVALFAVIFLLYTHSFLLKRRKKEFALYNILGMGKGDIAKVLLYETCYEALAGLVLGLTGGILLSKLMTLLLLKLLGAQPVMGFEVPPSSVLLTLGVFGAIFLLTYLSTLWQIHLTNPAELLRQSQAGEKEPKANWLIALLGVAALAVAYYIAITTEQPMFVLMLFFVAVILVVVGTFCLFTAGSVTGLKLLKRNKRYYYQTRHFVPVSGMIYRMKQNAAGLASVCILSTMVLVMLSSTFSLYVGLEDTVQSTYRRDITVSTDGGVHPTLHEVTGPANEALQMSKLSGKNAIAYRYMLIPMEWTGEGLSAFDGDDLSRTKARIAWIPYGDVAQLIQGVNAPSANEVLICAGEAPDVGDALSVSTERFRVAGRPSIDALAAYFSSQDGCDRYYAIVLDDDFERLLGVAQTVMHDERPVQMYYGFDVDVDIASERRLAKDIAQRAPGLFATSKQSYRAESQEIFGGLFFLGLFLGALFMMAMVLIIYYKQVSEGYDDRARFEILLSVGMSRQEVKTAIHSQVLTVFFLPLVAAGVHIAFAFPMITRMLSMLSLTNTRLFALSTVGALLAFGALYAVVYALTARVYYRIVAPAT